jgi:hypothetical protein
MSEIDAARRAEQATTGWLSLAYGAVFAVFIIVPAFLRGPFPPLPILGWAEAFDLVTPFAVVPLAWILALRAAPGPPSVALIFALLAATLLWAQGQGMHLGANAIGHLVEESHGLELGALVELFDEELSHFIWHAGVIGLAGIIAGREFWSVAGPTVPRAAWLAAVGGGILFGATFFMMIVEGRTAVIGIPAAAVLGILPFVIRRRALGRLPITTFTATGFLLAMALTAVWFTINGGTLPEFSDVGII